MTQIELRLITNIIEIFFVTYSLSYIWGSKYRLKDLGICIFLYLPCFFYLEDVAWNVYILRNVYLLLIFTFYLLKYTRRILKYMPFICVMLSVCGTVKILVGVLGGLTAEFISIERMTEETEIVVSTLFFMVLSIGLLIYILKHRNINLNMSFSQKCIAYFVYFLVIFGKIPFLYTGLQEARPLKTATIAMVCCTLIFFVISRIERYNAEMERAKIEENNKNLSSKLHKSQEIIPAVVQVLSDVAENSGKEMEEQETQKLLREMTDLFGQQLKENSKEDLQLKNFCSTGLKILDQQLKVYQMEAIDRRVNLDIYVQAPINDIIKRDDIDQLKLLRAVGDLIRNAFRVTEKNRKNVTINQNEKMCRANGHILLIIGCRHEGILEIEVVDNGDQFPIFVIEAFGRRGVTTGGTGNGLADLVEFADETKASLCVEEFDGKTNAFTKKVSIIFDKQRKNYYKSFREEQVKSSFWEKLNSV